MRHRENLTGDPMTFRKFIEDFGVVGSDTDPRGTAQDSRNGSQYKSRGVRSKYSSQDDDELAMKTGKKLNPEKLFGFSVCRKPST